MLKLKMPTSINGVAQAPIEGVSFAKTFDDPKAPLPREAQYFEMLGSRSIQLDGWRAHVGAPNWPSGEPTTAEYMDKAPWMLFNLNEDFSEAVDVAGKYPGQVGTVETALVHAGQQVQGLPGGLDDLHLRLVTPRPQMSGPRDKYVYYPGTGEVEANDAVDTRNRSHTITAEVEIGKDGAKGVLLANGGTFAGYSFFINKDQKLQYSHNYVGIEEYKVISKEKVPSGKLACGWNSKRPDRPISKSAKALPAPSRYYVNDKAVGSGNIPVTVPLAVTPFPATACRSAATRSPPSASTTWAAISPSRAERSAASRWISGRINRQCRSCPCAIDE